MAGRFSSYGQVYLQVVLNEFWSCGRLCRSCSLWLKQRCHRVSAGCMPVVMRGVLLAFCQSPATNRQPGLSPLAQQTETVQPGVPFSLRAKANAFSAGISRIFLTGLPRRPMNSTSQGVEPSFWTPG